MVIVIILVLAIPRWLTRLLWKIVRLVKWMVIGEVWWVLRTLVWWGLASGVIHEWNMLGLMDKLFV